jgi:hypothetical protein
MAIINDEPGYTQFDKVNITDDLLLRGSPIDFGNGSGLRFTSIAERQAYFSNPENLAKLFNSINCSVTTDQDTHQVGFYVWDGVDNPTVYDDNLWIIAAILTSPGTISLGGSEISSGLTVLNHKNAEGKSYALIQSQMRESGSLPPWWYKSGTAFNLVVSDVDDQELDGAELLITSDGLIAVGFANIITPLSAGTLRIRGWVGADDSTEPYIDVEHIITEAQVGTKVTLPNQTVAISDAIDNPIQQFIRYTGIKIAGGLQTSGILAGQTTIALESTSAFAERFAVLTEDNFGTEPGDAVQFEDIGGNAAYPAANGEQITNLTGSEVFFNFPEGAIPFSSSDGTLTTDVSSLSFNDTIDRLDVRNLKVLEDFTVDGSTPWLERGYAVVSINSGMISGGFQASGRIDIDTTQSGLDSVRVYYSQTTSLNTTVNARIVYSNPDNSGDPNNGQVYFTGSLNNSSSGEHSFLLTPTATPIPSQTETFFQLEANKSGAAIIYINGMTIYYDKV